MTNDHYTALILGGGPAGASCALWLKTFGYGAVIVESRAQLGGVQNDNPFAFEGVPGMAGLRGEAVAAGIDAHLRTHDIPAYTRSKLISLEREEDVWKAVIATHSGEKVVLHARYVVLATGVVPEGGGLVESPSVVIGPGKKIVDFDFRGKRVAILGGGDNALENFFYIRDRGAASVRVYARHLRARENFVRKMPVDAMSVCLYQVDQKTMSVNNDNYDVFAVFYGWAPANPLAQYVSLVLRGKGFVQTDACRRTSAPYVYAIGEVTQMLYPCVATAMADGVICARDIQERVEREGGLTPLS